MTFRLPILPGTLPEAEVEYGQALSEALGLVETLTDDFSSSLTLFDRIEGECEAIRRSIAIRTFPRLISEEEKLNLYRGDRWMQVCVRDGSITLWNILECTRAINVLVGRDRCSTLGGCINADRRRAAVRMFTEAFPDAAAVRHAITHCGQVTRDGQLAAAHMLQAGYQASGVNVTPRNFIEIRGRRFRTTHNGQVVGYDLTPESLAALERFRAELFDTFRPAQQYLYRRWEELRGAPPGTYTG